ncbi:unnamed protein product [Heligmosomoides polygyrus]|uniref:Cse1 domain-containing protein n=1 Tax=Heligmosomoides polygyrus TaxID=6339 RepID=A0A183G5K8_HELPZ|nr:unnamed protein product [Heligmosomoides polygyrus]
MFGGDYFRQAFETLIFPADKDNSVALPLSDPRYAVFLHLFRTDIVLMFNDRKNIQYVEEMDQFQPYFEVSTDIPEIMKELRTSDNDEERVTLAVTALKGMQSPISRGEQICR